MGIKGQMIPSPQVLGNKLDCDPRYQVAMKVFHYVLFCEHGLTNIWSNRNMEPSQILKEKKSKWVSLDPVSGEI
jgi:hypothetical protein